MAIRALIIFAHIICWDEAPTATPTYRDSDRHRHPAYIQPGGGDLQSTKTQRKIPVAPLAEPPAGSPIG
jgi:hypothetical protein